MSELKVDLDSLSIATGEWSEQSDRLTVASRRLLDADSASFGPSLSGEVESFFEKWGGIVSATSNLANSMALHLEQGRAAYDAMDAQAKLELDGFYQWLEDAR